MKIRGKLHGNYMLKQLPVLMASIRQDGIILFILSSSAQRDVLLKKQRFKDLKDCRGFSFRNSDFFIKIAKCDSFKL